MAAVDGLTGYRSKARVVAVASPTGVDASLAKRLILVAFDLSNSIAD